MKKMYTVTLEFTKKNNEPTIAEIPEMSEESLCKMIGKHVMTYGPPIQLEFHGDINHLEFYYQSKDVQQQVDIYYSLLKGKELVTTTVPEKEEVVSARAKAFLDAGVIYKT